MNPNCLAVSLRRGCAQTYRRPPLLLPAVPLQVSIRYSQQHAKAVLLMGSMVQMPVPTSSVYVGEGAFDRLVMFTVAPFFPSV